MLAVKQQQQQQHKKKTKSRFAFCICTKIARSIVRYVNTLHTHMRERAHIDTHAHTYRYT